MEYATAANGTSFLCLSGSSVSTSPLNVLTFNWSAQYWVVGMMLEKIQLASH